MSIEQIIDQRLKEQLGELLVQNIARQARVEELQRDLAATQARLHECEQKMRDDDLPLLAGMKETAAHKANGAG